MELNFNNSKKQFLTVTLPDEDQTKLLVKMPRKGLLDKVLALQKNAEEMNEDNISQIYEVTAEILNRNVGNKKIDAEKLGKLLDFEDLFILFNAYVEFIAGVANQKNLKSPTTP